MPFEADGEAQDLGAGELGRVGPLGERGGRLLEVGPVELDPPAARPDERAGLGGEPGDLGRGELDVVEHRRPAHVAQLVGADHGVAGRLGEQAQRRASACGATAPAPAPRSRRPRAPRR